MKLSKILFPHRFKLVGWILFGPFAMLTCLTAFHEFTFDWLDVGTQSLSFAFNFEDKNLTNEVAILGIMVSLFLVSFSREKEEDEFIQKIRMDSLLIACYGYFLIHVLVTLIFFGLAYLSFIFFNMFTIPVLFLIRFHWILMKERKKLDLAS